MQTHLTDFSSGQSPESIVSGGNPARFLKRSEVFDGRIRDKSVFVTVAVRNSSLKANLFDSQSGLEFVGIPGQQ